VDRFTIPEAADLLGVTQSAVWQRIKRGTIPNEKDSDGKTHVFLEASEAPEQATDTVNDESPNGLRDDLLHGAMQDQIDTLKREVEDWKEEARRKDHIIMSLTQRIPELEPAIDVSPGGRESSETVSEKRSGE
jgi:hypothetical protein